MKYLHAGHVRGLPDVDRPSFAAWNEVFSLSRLSCFVLFYLKQPTCGTMPQSRQLWWNGPHTIGGSSDCAPPEAWKAHMALDDKEAMTKKLNYPNAYIGLSDGGAHVQFHGGYGYSTRLLGYWVRQEGIMSKVAVIFR